MKAHHLLIVVSALACLSVSAVAKPAPVQMLLKGRKVAETGYVTKAEAGKVFFSASPTGKNERGYPSSTIVQLVFKAPEGWDEAEAARLSKNYAEAEKLYNTIAIDYRKIASLEDNYSSLARLRQLECLRDSGEYGKLGKVIPNLKKSGLNEKYHVQVDLFVGWAALGDLSSDAKIDSLERMINGFREIDMLPGQLAQAFYISAVANEKRGNASSALTDYYRAFTLDFGANRDMARKAINSALLLYAAEDRLHKDRSRLEEAHALAATYQKVFVADLPKEAERFAEPLPPLEDQ